MSEKPSLFIIPGYPIYPIDRGSAIAQMVFIDRLKKRMDITMAISPGNVKKELIPEFRMQWKGINFIEIGYSDTASSKKAFGSEIVKKQLIYINEISRKLIDNLYGHEKEAILERIMNKFLVIPKWCIEGISSIVKVNKFDIIQTELSPNLGLINIFPDNCLKIFVHHEIVFERISTEIKAQAIDSEHAKYMLNQAKMFEAALLNKYDAIFALSKENKQTLSEKVNVPIFVSPYPLFDNDIQLVNDLDSEITHLIFIGPQIHSPNRDAVKWIIHELLPILNNNELNLELIITGSWGRRTIKKYSHIKQVKFAGFVDDIDKVMKNGIMLSPVRIGSGLRTKILMAMAKGVPVISTGFACSGIGVTNGENIIIAESPEEHVKSIKTLLDNKTVLIKIRKNAHNFIKKEFAQKRLVNQRMNYYEELLKTNRLISYSQ